MPAIQVYKGNGVMIPVDVAKQAKAYVCPWTNELFATKRSYVGHLKKLRTERMHRRAKYLRLQRKLQELWNQPDFKSVVKHIHDNPELFWELGKRSGWASDNKKWDSIRDEFTITIKYLDVAYSDNISNSHSCPHNGKTNWGGREVGKDGVPVPRGYPGFGGRITYKLSHDTRGFGSDVTKGTRIHTGTGGGGGDLTYSYDVKFFLDDWPGLKKHVEDERKLHEKNQMIKTLSRKRTEPFVKTFTYGKDR